MKSDVWNARADFRKRWSETFFDVPPEDESKESRKFHRMCCEYGAEFTVWCEHTLRAAHEAPTGAILQQAFALLQHEFVARFKSLPASHRSKRPMSEHICVLEIFLQEYELLKEIEDFNMLSGFARNVDTPKPSRKAFFETDEPWQP